MAERNYILVSDLHLSEGFMKDKQCYHVNEDFFYDDAFARFLDYLEKEKKAGRFKKQWRLVINGDFLDFLQVTTAPEELALQDFLETATGATYDDGAVKVGKKERKLGLGFDADKSLWKLARVVEGHPLFFEALTKFLKTGNDVVIVTGNHDAEFTYPEVRRYLRRVIDDIATSAGPGRRGAAGGEPSGRKPSRSAPVSSRVFFSRWFYCEEGLFYAEHGGQYDGSNRYVFFLDPTMYLPDKKTPTIRFPFGSFFVRYFFNKLEERVPFTDNIRPRGRAFIWVITKRTWYAVLESGTLIRFAANFVRKKIFSHFDLLAFLEWLRLKKNILARGAYYLFFFPVIKFVIRPDPEQYVRYKLRNFWFMFEAENTNGLIPEGSAPVGEEGPSLLDLLKIYNRSFREGAITAEREKELVDLLRATVPAEAVEAAAAEHMSTSEIMNDVVYELSSAAGPKPLIRICLFKSWRFAATVISAASVVGAFLFWLFNVSWIIIPLLGLGLITYLVRGLGEEILRRYFDVEPEKYLNKAAEGIARILDVPYVILGHTHVAYIRPLKAAGEGEADVPTRWEVNTGSWTPVYDEKMMLRRTGDEFPFIRIITEGKGEPELKLLHWNDELGEPQAIRYTGGC